MSKFSDLIENAEAVLQSKISDPNTKAILGDTFAQLKSDANALGSDAVVGLEGAAETGIDASLTGAVGPVIAPVIEIPLHSFLAAGFAMLLSKFGVHPTATVSVSTAAPVVPTVSA